MSPLGGGTGDDHKVFVLLLSTNADAISDTIGAIAEDATMKQTLFRLANKEAFQEKARLDATKTVVQSERNAIVAQLDSMFAPGGVLSAESANDVSYLSALAALAGALEPNAPARFRTFDEAGNWFDSVHIERGS